MSSKFHPAVLQCVALAPVVWWFGKRLDDGCDEPLGLLTLALACVLAWRDRKSLHANSRARFFGAVLLLLSVLGIHWLPPLLRAGLAVAGVATCYEIHRRAGLIGLLALSLPVAAAEGTVRLLELGSVVVFHSGTQIELGGQVIGVDPACGGVRMLWHALAAIHRLTWRATVIGGLLAIALVIPAGIIRAALLVVTETGRLPETFLGHGGIGLVSFAMILLPLWAAISSRARPAFPAGSGMQAGRVEWMVLAGAAVLAPVLAFGTPEPPEPPKPPELGRGPDVFTFNGLVLPLHALPPTEAEIAFAKSFPGTLSSHRWGADQVILRRVNQATRRLHPSGDCLRAAAFETTEAITVRLADGSCWARFSATRDGLRLTVHERITSGSDGSSWTDVSAWYWAALWHPLNGPWQAETVIGE